MTSSAATELRAFLERARRRVFWIDAVHGAAGGLGIAFVLALVNVLPRGATVLAAVATLLLAAAGAIAETVRARMTRKSIATQVEARAPACRNIVITADELSRPTALQDRVVSGDMDRSTRVAAPAYVGEIVVGEAARIVRTLDLATLFPARNAILAFALAATLVGLVSARDTLPLRTASRAIRRAVPATAIAIENVEITITPPSYTAQPPRTLRDVARIDALVGSRIRLRIRAAADSLLVQTLRGTRTVTPTSPELFTVDVDADDDGFVTLAPRGAAGRAGPRRLIGISVQHDQLPRVTIATPGHDLLLKDARRPIELRVEADDDLGMASLRLRYTKVSGSGERFTFSDGEVPLNLSRTSPRSWKASGALRLDSMGLSPGDMVVYRAVASDHRPGAPSQESDSFIAEIVAPGNDAAAGFSIDPDQERYAVSQQMVILKTERLIARRATMPPDSTTNASQELAAEQRKVRAEFVFMMGGELADAPDPAASMTDLNEEAEAEGEADIAAGRLANQGRMALVRAIRYMSRAATTLTNVELGEALKSEKAALAQLEQAFSRTRILLRALSEREQLDMTRRLSGTLTDARSVRQGTAAPPIDVRGAALRRVLAELATVAHEGGADTLSIARLTALAEAVLRVDPSSRSLQQVSARLSDAAASLAKAQRSEAWRWLDSATVALAIELRRDAPSVAPNTMTFARSQLAGALGDALRGTPVQPRARPSVQSARQAASPPRR